MAASNLRMVVCNTEETERDLGELVQLLLKVLQTSRNKLSVQQLDVGMIDILGDLILSNRAIIRLLPLATGAIAAV